MSNTQGIPALPPEYTARHAVAPRLQQDTCRSCGSPANYYWSSIELWVYTWRLCHPMWLVCLAFTIIGLPIAVTVALFNRKTLQQRPGVQCLRCMTCKEPHAQA